MKLALISMTVFAVAYGAVLPPHASTFGLKEDFNKFAALLPKDEILSIAIDYLANDAEVQETFEYLQSDDFKTLIVDIENIAEYQQFLSYLQENGLNVYYYLQKLHELLNLPDFEPRAISLRRGNGVRGLIDDVKAVLPVDKIKALYYELLETSPAFANLVNVLKGDDFKSVVETLRANPEFVKLIQRAKDHGIDIQLIVDLLNKIFGWGIETRSAVTFGLQDDLQDFLKLVPVNQIVGIVMDYLANDAEVQEVFEYAQSDEFKKLVQDVDNVDEYIQFLNYLQKNGLDVYTAVNAFHDFLGLDKLPVPQRNVARRGKGMRGLLDDILASLPVDKIKALYYEKLETSPEFAKLAQLLSGSEFKGLIEKLQANPTFQEIVERARSHGIDVDHIVEILNKIFGWGIEARSAVTFGLQDDLQDFLKLVPVNQIVGIVMDYLANDAEVQEVFEYAQSDEFKKLVQDVDNVDEYIQFLNYLQKNGLDVYTAVNAFHDFLGLDKLPVPQRNIARRGKGMRGLLDDILASLPVDKIKALYYEKLETSPEFAKLAQLLSGSEFKGLIEKLQANPTFQEIVERARSHGIDVDHIVEILNKIFGWGIEARSAVTFGLQDDLQDFLKLVPVNQIVGIVMDYLANDAEVQEVFEYAQSDEFKKLVQDVDNVDEYIQFLNYLQKNGLDVYTAVNAFHDFLGLDKLPVPQRNVARRGKGMRGLLDDILASLPVDKIKALYYEKLETSPEFAKLAQLLSGSEFKGLIEKLQANPTFQEIVERARSHGIDVDHIVEILNKIFGWGIEARSAVTFGLQDDLQDFLKLVPVNQIVGIVMDYLANDAEVQEVFEYAQSDEFKKLVQDVDNVDEYIQFLNYLQKNGLDVYTAVNAFHDFLGLDKLPVPQRNVARRGKGMRGLLDDILASLPVDKIKALYYEKLETSPEFAKLAQLLSGSEFKGLIEKLQANPTFQEIVERARSHGIDVDHIVEILNKIFGWGIEARSAVTFGLQDDLQDFLKLVPVNQIVGIVMDYLANDAEVQEVFEYAQSDEFKKLVQDVDNVDEYIQFLNYLQKNGLDVYTAVNAFHDFLGLDKLPVPQRNVARRGKGMRGLLDDILASLPVDKIKALYYEKLETSPEFAKLAQLLSGSEFKGLIEKLQANPTFQEIVERARSHGIDVDHIVEILNKIFGWGIEARSAVTFGLQDDLQDFLKLVPVNQIVGIVMDYLANDAEVQEVFEYAQSDEFKKLVQDVDNVDEYIQFLNYLQKNGLDVYTAVNAFHDFLGLDKLPVPQRNVARRGKGMRGLLDDILASLPVDKIKALYYEKLETSPEFAKLAQLLSGSEFKGLIEKLQANPTFQEIVERARSHGIDVDHIVEILNKIFGWGIEARSAVTFGLQDDLQDFLKLVPVNQIVGIVMDYLANDAEVQEVFEYAQSDEFKKLVQDVDNVDEYIQFLNYLQKNGLDVYTAVNAFHDFLGLDKLPVPQRNVARRGKGMRGLLDDILASLPVDKIKALYYEKLETSPEFAKLAQLLSGSEFKGLIEKLQANPTFQEIVERARSHGIDVDHIVEILNKIFGWGIEARSAVTFGLQDDLQDFLKLVPVNQIVGIVMDYLANDAEVQEVFEYAQSDEFKKLVQDVDNVDEYIQFLNYLQKNGLDVYTAVNAFHDFLGLDKLPVPQRNVARRGKGMRGLLDDILASLPVDKIKALYYEKLETSPEFAKLVQLLSGSEFKGLIEKLQANPTFQEIVERARSHGIDVDHIVEILNKIFGWGLEY